MLTDHAPEPADAEAPARSGHGVASIIPRLHEEIARPSACDGDGHAGEPPDLRSPEDRDGSPDKEGS